MVAQQPIWTEVGDVEIVAAVVVEVAGGDPDAVLSARDAHLSGHVGESHLGIEVGFEIGQKLGWLDEVRVFASFEGFDGGAGTHLGTVAVSFVDFEDREQDAFVTLETGYGCDDEVIRNRLADAEFLRSL